MGDFEQALSEAQQWMDEQGVVAVGEGDDGGRVIDVWVQPELLAQPLPDELHGVRVRVRDAGGPVQALDEQG